MEMWEYRFLTELLAQAGGMEIALGSVFTEPQLDDISKIALSLSSTYPRCWKQQHVFNQKNALLTIGCPE